MSVNYRPGHLPYKAITSLPSGIYFVRWWFDGKTNYIQQAASKCPEVFQGVPVKNMKFEFIKMK